MATGKQGMRSNPENNGRSEMMRKNKKVLLAAVEQYGGNTKAMKAAGISKQTYYSYIRNDPDFKEDLEQAKIAFGESMLEIAIDRVKNPDKGKGGDILLISLLNAYMSHVFKPTTVVGEDTAKELITEWRKAARSDAKKKSEQPLPENMEDTLDDILNKKK
tara:strand:+ start:777 stop:1259 length:483 start_codon:yes stop_codon:yes gene_type:complete